MQMLGKGVLRLGEPTCVAVPRGLLIFRVPGANPQAESQSLRVVLGVSWYTHRGQPLNSRVIIVCKPLEQRLSDT